MLRISKVTDYGTVIMAQLARYPARSQTANEIAQRTRIPLPMTSKILKQLTQHRLLLSQRGTQGGYSLALAPEKISLADIVNALDGDIALTECTQSVSQCVLEMGCTMRSNWSLINRILQTVLANISLAVLTDAQLTPQKLSEQLRESLVGHAHVSRNE